MRTVFPSQLTSEATAVTTSDWCVVQLDGETKLRKMRPGLLPDGAISTIKIADKAVTLAKSRIYPLITSSDAPVEQGRPPPSPAPVLFSAY